MCPKRSLVLGSQLHFSQYKSTLPESKKLKFPLKLLLDLIMNWIIPFKGRGHSGVIRQNFLFQSNNIYVMDNHRAAMWCWLDFYKGSIQDVGVFHLDRHTDTLQSHLGSWVSQALAPIHVGTMDIHTYLDRVDSGFPQTKLFRWDNYLSIFLDIYQSQVTSCHYSAFDGDTINHSTLVKVEPRDIPENLDFWISKGKWIINIDLDYFFFEANGSFSQMYSDEYLRELFDKVAITARRNSEIVVTICFSPECCGGWPNSERVWNVAESCLKTGLILPP
jgi:hypothetical protein